MALETLWRGTDEALLLDELGLAPDAVLVIEAHPQLTLLKIGATARCVIGLLRSWPRALKLFWGQLRAGIGFKQPCFESPWLISLRIS